MLARLAAMIFGDIRPIFRLNRDERQGLMQMGLIAGELVLTLAAVGLFVFDHHMITYHGGPSALAQTGLDYVWRLMGIHVAAIAFIAIGDVVSAKFGDWLELRRSEQGGGE